MFFSLHFHLQRVPKGLEDVSRYPYLFAELLADSERWTEEDIAKLAGRNLIRVFRQVEQVSHYKLSCPMHNLSPFISVYVLSSKLGEGSTSNTRDARY